MKPIDINQVHIVDSGQSWVHQKKPCHKDMLQYLEQNEAIVTWVCPKGSSRDIHSMFPVIRINQKYYTISLRMMKIIWRHVKLEDGFVNTDLSHNGRPRLRIPEKLFAEKKRTQDRFNEMRARVAPQKPPAAAGAAAGAKKDPGAEQQRAHGANIHCKSYKLFCEEIMPMVTTGANPLPELTTFVFNEEEILASILAGVQHKCPELYKNRETFMKTVEGIVYSDGAPLMQGH